MYGREREKSPSVTLAAQTSGSEAAWFELGPVGILDTGATKTVIGSQLVSHFLKALSPKMQKKISRSECRVTLKFGNQGTLQSTVAIVIPLGRLLLRVAVVPGGTPFLLSNTLVRRLKATIDTAHDRMFSPYLSEAIDLTMTNRGLYVMNVESLADMMEKACNLTGTTFHAETTESIVKSDASDTQMSSVHATGEAQDSRTPSQAAQTHGAGGEARASGDPMRGGRPGRQHPLLLGEHAGGDRKDLQPESAATVDAPDAQGVLGQHQCQSPTIEALCGAQADGPRGCHGLETWRSRSDCTQGDASKSMAPIRKAPPTKAPAVKSEPEEEERLVEAQLQHARLDRMEDQMQQFSGRMSVIESLLGQIVAHLQPSNEAHMTQQVPQAQAFVLQAT